MEEAGVAVVAAPEEEGVTRAVPKNVEDAAAAGSREAPLDLVERARRSPDGFAELYERYYRRIFNYVMRTMMNPTAAEDVVSETFLRAMRGMGTYRGGPDRLETWLYRIATNAMMDHFRKRAKEMPLDEERAAARCRELLADAAAPESIARLERYERLHRALRRLKDIHRVALVLHYFEEKPLKEVAQIVGCSTGTVKWRMSRGRKRLQSMLSPEDLTI